MANLILTKEYIEMITSKLSQKDWSYSSLKKYEKCPYDFYRTYILEDRPEAPNTFFGSALHIIVESIINKQRYSPKAIFEEYKVDKHKWSEFLLGIENCREFLEKIIPHGIQSEVEFHFNIKGHKFVCFIDILNVTDKEVIIYDIKSSSNDNYSSEYDLQAMVYFYALSKLYPEKKVKTYLFYPLIGNKVKENTPKMTVDQIEEDLLKRLNSIFDNMNFDPTTHKMCSRFCPFFKTSCIEFN